MSQLVTDKKFSLALAIVWLAVFPSLAAAAVNSEDELEAETRFEQNLEKARNGDMMAQHKLASLYEQGIGVRKDLAQAFKWYQRSAEQGNIKAEYQVGYMYFLGRGVDQDLAKAKTILEKVAGKGYVAAQYMMGHMYEKGLGVTANVDQAQQWYVRAANNGYLNAKYALKKIDEDMAAEQQHRPAEVEPPVEEKARAPVTVPPPRQAAEPAAAPAQAAARNRLPSSREEEDRDIAMLDDGAGRNKTAAAAVPPSVNTLAAVKTSVAKLKPEIMHRKAKVKDLLRIIGSNGWVSNSLPARLLPSDRTTCKAQLDGSIECLSDRLERKIDKATVIYQTRSVLSDISEFGEFTLTYRNNVLDVSTPRQADGFWEEASVPIRLGWQDTQHEMLCRLNADDKGISCTKESGSDLLFARKDSKAIVSAARKSAKR